MDRIIILHYNTNVMSSDASNESEKILESLFEPDNAEILLELKSGPKPLSALTEKIDISEGDLDERLSYLIEKGFVKKEGDNDGVFYSLDSDRLTKVLESDDNFKNIDDGLAKLDSFLN
jgi:DNA-binding HxlR family transcriptional regulator